MQKKQKKSNSRNIFVAFILNLAFAIIEFLGGLFTNSVSIMSDSVHDLGDAISIAISWVLEKKAQKEPDSKYTFGYTRYSVLGALITSTVLLLGSVIMIYNAIIRLINPVPINYNGMIVLAILGFLVNGIGALVTSHSNRLNEKAVSLHMLEDVLGWVAVLVASIFMKLFDLAIVDSILSICITIYILWHVVQNYKVIFGIFLQKAPNDVNIEKLKTSIIIGNKKIREIHHVHLWQLDDINIYASLHVVLPKDITTEEIITIQKYIKSKLDKNKISHVTIQIEFEDEECKDKKCDVKLDCNCGSCCYHNHKVESQKRSLLGKGEIQI